MKENVTVHIGVNNPILSLIGPCKRSDINRIINVPKVEQFSTESGKRLYGEDSTKHCQHSILQDLYRK